MGNLGSVPVAVAISPACLVRKALNARHLNLIPCQLTEVLTACRSFVRLQDLFKWENCGTLIFTNMVYTSEQTRH
jgi:hypothetical protein